MALEKQPVSWPLTGGLDSKTGPLVLQSGSFLRLDDVRQERANEWRTRSGTSHAAADDPAGSVAMLRAVEMPRGGVLGMTADVVAQPSSTVYSPSTGASQRWLRSNSDNSSQMRPKVWSRRSLSTTVYTPGGVSHASSGTITLTAWWSLVGGGAHLVHMALQTAAEGDSLTSHADTFLVGVGNTPMRPRCSYNASANVLMLVWVELTTGNVRALTVNGTTGAVTNVATTIAGGAHPVDPYIDAVYYTGANTTVVFRLATGQIRYLEVNPTTLATPTAVTLAVAADTCLALLPDPDASAIRFVAAYDTTANQINILRVNSAGAIQSTDTFVEAIDVEQIAGVAYTAGADWQIVYETSAALTARRKSGGVVGAATAITSGLTGRYSLATGAWREPGTDPMRYMIRYRGAEGLIGPTDIQRTYYEMAQEFFGGPTLFSTFREAQSRMLPFDASGDLQNASLAHVQRTGTDTFETALIRLLHFDLAAGVEADQWAIDRWQVKYMNPTNAASLNTGAGVSTGSTAYLPDGQLIQSGCGDLVCGHGGSTVPIVASMTAAAGAGALTALAKYQYLATCDMWDDAGNLWHSPPSTPQVTTLVGGQNQITVLAWFGEFELRIRKRTVKLWRTLGNGSVFRLLYSATALCSNNNTVTFLDQKADSVLAQSEFLPADLPTALTPAFSHIALFGNRLWGVERDFPQNIWFSKPLQAGSAPEFPEEFTVNVEDATGAPTSIIGMDDKIVLFKAGAIYVSSGTSVDNTGAGQFPEFVRLDSDVGSVGPHVASTGGEVFFASARGPHRMDKSLQITPFLQLDQYFNQPLVQTPEVVTGAVFSSQENEIRFHTANYRFVFDRDEEIWVRDTGGMAGTVITRMVGSLQALFRSNGQMWFESVTASDDGGTTFFGRIRSAWVGPPEGWLRLYRSRAVGLRTATGVTAAPTMNVYMDNDDTPIHAATGPTNLPARFRAEVRSPRQKCSRFSLELLLPVGDHTIRLDAWWAMIGLKRGSQPLTQNDRWA